MSPLTGAWCAKLLVKKILFWGTLSYCDFDVMSDYRRTCVAVSKETSSLDCVWKMLHISFEAHYISKWHFVLVWIQPPFWLLHNATSCVKSLIWRTAFKCSERCCIWVAELIVSHIGSVFSSVTIILCSHELLCNYCRFVFNTVLVNLMLVSLASLSHHLLDCQCSAPQ